MSETEGGRNRKREGGREVEREIKTKTTNTLINAKYSGTSKLQNEKVIA